MKEVVVATHVHLTKYNQTRGTEYRFGAGRNIFLIWKRNLKSEASSLRVVFFLVIGDYSSPQSPIPCNPYRHLYLCLPSRHSFSHPFPVVSQAGGQLPSPVSLKLMSSECQILQTLFPHYVFNIFQLFLWFLVYGFI